MSNLPSRQDSGKPPNSQGQGNSARPSNLMGGDFGGNSDNSDSKYSIGNNSFGFNFDSEDGSSPTNSDGGEDPTSGHGKNPAGNARTNTTGTSNATALTIIKEQDQQQQQQQPNQPVLNAANAPVGVSALGRMVSSALRSTASTAPTSSATSVMSNITGDASVSVTAPQNIAHEAAVAATMAQLQTIASASITSSIQHSSSIAMDAKMGSDMNNNLKRKPKMEDYNGYQPEDAQDRAQGLSLVTSATSAVPANTVMIQQHSQPEEIPSTEPSKKKPKVDSMIKREERNKREKERSYRITTQINELRGLLSTGGVIVPKGTKNAVLTEAANYIRILQQHQYKSEIHRQQLIQQMQLIGGGQLGAQAADAIRHVAATNGVWSLGNFGGVPPRSAMAPATQGEQPQAQQDGTQSMTNEQSNVNNSQTLSAKQDQLMKNIEDHDYRFVFNSCTIAMAIASMGGAFIDCNQLFISLSEYSKQEICGLTIFNLTAREDLQSAFDLISQMISPPADSCGFAPSCVLRGNMNSRTDLGLSITLIKDEEGIAKCFCVSLIKNPASPFDNSTPIHATADFIRQEQVQMMEAEKQQRNMSSPAFMAG